jgi:uncharacterized protein (TIGR02302 family)
MPSRPSRVRLSTKTDTIGGPQLTLARLIVQFETFLRFFARPLMVAGIFLALAWLGVFAGVYPWLHLIALLTFVVLFFHSLGKARAHWRPPSLSTAKRRVEEASHLKHRLLDVVEDRPISSDGYQMQLWRIHVDRAKAQLSSLRWPQWKLNFAEFDPYALRYALLAVLIVGAVFSWGALGGRLLAAINPALGKELHRLRPALDAWITPPEYTGLPPIMIATPAGVRHDGDMITIPEGSMLNAHLAEHDGDALVLSANGEKSDFTESDRGDFQITQPITSGDTIAIHRGWQNLGSWKIRVVTDQPPQIAFTDPPSTTERKTVRLAYHATDDYSVTTISARITPRESLPGISNDPLEVPLADPQAKDVQRASFADLTAHPWAGLPVQIQLIATDAIGNRAVSAAVDFTLPERVFLQPVARALIEERKKLLLHPEDDGIRNETTNVMAGIARQPATYRGDPVVLMALRAGAVRLVLDHGTKATASVYDMIWQSAARIEDGGVNDAENLMRQAQKELADALDRNASEQEVQTLIDRLHQALAQYLAQMASHMASDPPGPTDELSQLMGAQRNVMSPKDLDRMLQDMRNLSASGSRDAARQQLAMLQQLLENMRAQRPQLSPQQHEAMQHLKELHQLIHDQQQLLDKTFQSAQHNDKADVKTLAHEQNDLLRRLRDMLTGMKEDKSLTLEHAAEAMKGAGDDLRQGAAQGALPRQNEALRSMQQVENAMADEVRQSLMMLPGPGGGLFGEGSDPFGRNTNNLLRDDGGVKVPDQMEVRRVREILNELQRRAGDMGRSQTERDYIDRLLQNF